MRKRNQAFLSLACMLLLMTGCSKTQVSEQPYRFAERDFLTAGSTGTDGERAEGFAADLCVVDPASLTEDPLVTSEAAATFDLSGRQVIFGKNPFETLYPASITKVMTAILAIKYGNLQDQVTVPADAVIKEAGASLCNVKPGDVLTLEQLLYGLMLPSGNDAAVAIAEHLSGSLDAFSDLMNEEAKRIGATGTHFVNPHGLSNENHYTTAYDLYLIFNEALSLPEFRTITGATAYTADYTNAAGAAVSKTWKGGNWYMTGERDTPAGLTVFSSKTGTTKAAGYCLIMASRDEKEQEYISVILKADSRPHLYDNMSEIIQKITN